MKNADEKKNHNESATVVPCSTTCQLRQKVMKMKRKRKKSKISQNEQKINQNAENHAAIG